MPGTNSIPVSLRQSFDTVRRKSSRRPDAWALFNIEVYAVYHVPNSLPRQAHH
jgi:hypothetical protein